MRFHFVTLIQHVCWHNHYCVQDDVPFAINFELNYTKAKANVTLQVICNIRQGTRVRSLSKLEQLCTE